MVRRSYFGHPKCALTTFISGHPLNHALELILPDARIDNSPYGQESSPIKPAQNFQNTPILGTERATFACATEAISPQGLGKRALDALTQQLGSRRYTLVRSNLACLVEHDFVERHIRGEAASFCALSVNTSIDSGDSAAILPDGRLHLAVSEDTYRRLGLQGAHVPHNPGKQCRHQAFFSVHRSAISPGMPNPRQTPGLLHLQGLLDMHVPSCRPIPYRSKSVWKELPARSAILQEGNVNKQSALLHHTSTRLSRLL